MYLSTFLAKVEFESRTTYTSLTWVEPLAEQNRDVISQYKSSFKEAVGLVLDELPGEPVDVLYVFGRSFGDEKQILMEAARLLKEGRAEILLLMVLAASVLGVRNILRGGGRPNGLEYWMRRA